MAGRGIVAVIAGAGLISALVSGAGHLPGFSVREAQASCITWQGGQNCDSPAPRQTYHYSAPARSGGVRTFSGGGGGGRAGAAIGAAGAAIGILGMMIDAAQQQQENAANESQRQAYNACQARIRNAHATNEQARKLLAESDPEEAYRVFERAIGALGDCGNRGDAAKLRHNLDVARQSYASLTTPSAGTQYGGDAPKNHLRSVVDIEAKAAELCGNLPQDTPQRQICVRTTEAQLIMFDDAGIQSACQSIADVETRNRCALNRYGAMMSGLNPDQFGDNDNCYFDEHGKPCHPGGGNVASRAPLDANSDPNSLRNELKRRLAERPAQNNVAEARAGEIARAKALRDSLPPDSPDRKALDDVIAKAEAGQVPASSVSASTAPASAGTSEQPAATDSSMADANATSNASPGASKDDAYDNYMKSGNANSGGKNNGDLSRSDSFSMSGSGTQTEINRLTRP